VREACAFRFRSAQRRGDHDKEMRKRAILIVAAVILAFGTVPAVHAASLGALAKSVRSGETKNVGLFGKAELKAGSMKALPKWNKVLFEMKRRRKTLTACVANQAACKPTYIKRFRRAVLAARGKPKLQQLKIINSSFNPPNMPYKLDMDNYRTRDYWASPFEFLFRSGDCEDYSITKFYALLELGWRNKDLRIVALYDRIRGLGHAILAVKLNGDEYVLDNQASVVMSHKRYKHYDPQYSVNETTRWAHIGKLRKSRKSKRRAK
jgi:predicted transglutaminase-like cysteine proteinase